MELEEEENNLRAMRLLYRLLEHNSLGLQNTNSDDLVERARELLKVMLEVASERVFETLLKIIAAEAGISKTLFTSQPVASLQSRPLLAANSSHCSVKYPTRGRFSSWKDEQPQSKSLAKKSGPRLSKCSISDKGEAVRKALFNVCEESCIMQQDLVKAANFSYENPIFPMKENSRREQHYSVSTFHVGEHSKQSPDTFDSRAGEFREVRETSLPYRVCEIESNSSCAEAQDEEGDITNDLFNVIKRIESRILALQLYSNLVYSKKNGAGGKSMCRMTDPWSPIGQKSEGIAGNRPSYRKPPFVGNALMNQQANQLASKRENLTTANTFLEPILTGNESQSKVEDQILDQANDHGITTQESRQKGEACRATLLASRGEKLLSQNGLRPPSQSMAMVDRFQSLNRSMSGNGCLENRANECIQGLRIPLTSTTAGPTNRDKRTRRNPVAQLETHRREKQPLHHTETRQALPHWISSEPEMPPHGYRDREILENRGTHKMRASSPNHHESEEFSLSSRSPARLTSNQSSAFYSSESEDIGDSPGKMVSEAYEDSSGESSDLYSQNDAGSSNRMGSSRSSRSWDRRGPEKTIGHLRRLKNKLRLIFHHHHHLHHHHHHDKDDDKMSKADHRHSIWQRIFHGKNKHRLLAKGRAEKTRGGATAKVSHGKQVGQFHGLVEGLVRRIRHPKKQKPSNVVKIKGSRNLKRGNRKKLHWWQMLRRHRGVRLNNRGRLKVGFKSQKRLKY
ncbi:uncharacterized protein LOC129309420 isoform X2 [Prosopis cineraria]|uniref:uncharacterized protein LOC129309420 isoform X2 n=1 Tax=Prosopis cineraria TaxID=364024 RepID=UPI00240F8E99|nr:uncharacterized protein LOC129309420 isoform X2 [Prosopis cineraria]